MKSDERREKLVALVKQACQGNDEAFAEIYTLYRDDLFRYLAGLLYNKEDAKDLSQEVFLKVWRNLPYLQDPSSFLPWLYRVAHNLVSDYLRRKKRITWQSLEEVSPGSESMSDQDPADRLYQRDLIRDTLVLLAKQVPANVYRCFLLVAATGCSREEVAEVLYIGEKTVSVYVSQARTRFRQIYEYLENNATGEE